MHQILIVEDDPALSQGIRLALGQEGRQFVQAGTIGQAELELAERTFDLLILDLNLPDGNGLDLLSRLRDRSALPVLILTANDLEMDQVIGLELGADDYVTKPFSLAVLRARVNSLLRRSRPAPAALELPPFLFDFDAMVFARDGVPLELSKTEQRLLRLLVEHRGQTLSREVLLDRVWDGGEFVDENALSVAVNRLRAKLADAPIRSMFSKPVLWYTCLRLVLYPLLLCVLLKPLHLDTTLTNVCILMTGMPAGSTGSILADKYDCDAVFASQIAFASTLCSILTIPLLTLVMESFPL